MLDELISLTRSLDFDEDYQTIVLEAVEAEADILTLSLNLNTNDVTDAHQTWEIECVGVLDHQITLGQCDGVDLFHDHVLLWPYIYPDASVSFYGEAKDPLAVVGALMNCHLDLVNDWLPFSRFINGYTVEMIAGRYGILADGPMPLMESYAKVLESFGIGSRVSEPRAAGYTNDEVSGLAEIPCLFWTADAM